MRPTFCLFAVCLFALSALASDADRVRGPVSAEVIRVIDGDSIEVTARIWLGQTVQTQVRILGLDTPELRGACLREREAAQAARDFLVTRLAQAKIIELEDVGYDKYGRRVVARLLADGQDITQVLIQRGLARPYNGGKKSNWC